MLKIILAIVLFSVIVIFHELGHFLLAKKNGICVEEFAIGIGPTIFGKQIGETKYSVKCLPFGGCCVMLGKEKRNLCRRICDWNRTNYFWKADRRDQVFRKVSSIWRLLCYAWRR